MHRKIFWLAAIIVVLVAVTAAIIVVRAFSARQMDDLQIWHTVDLTSEFSAGRDGDRISFDTYREIEQRLFDELERKVVRSIDAEHVLRINRFVPDGPHNPQILPRNWNLTFDIHPAPVRGAALLLHGLTDSPYSLRSVAQILSERQFYVLGLRLPGHGTAPAGIRTATRQDWQAAVRVAARQVLSVAGDRLPFVLVGYSNGATLSLQYTLDALDDPDLAVPDQLILLSPAVGVTPFGFFADWHKVLSFIPYFNQFRWQNIDPEYDPFKYNSFPKNAGLQSYRSTVALQKQLKTSFEKGRLTQFPPVITFLSLVDKTVSTDATIRHLYLRLDNDQSELVIFDINRQADTRTFLKSDHQDLLQALESRDDLPFRLTVVTNASAASPDVVARSKAARSGRTQIDPLGLRWPEGIFSLSHVAIPFPVDDAIYGIRGNPPGQFGINLGSLEPRGERGMLKLSLEQLMRLRCNPFFPYVEQRIVETVDNLIADGQ